MYKYEIKLLEQVKQFLDQLDERIRKKVIYNIWKSREINDS